MNEELLWLAENVNQWDEKMDRVARQPYGSQWFDQASFPNWEGFTREQWQAARDELAGQQKEWMRPCPDCGGIDFEHDEECEAMTHNEEINLFSSPDEDEAWAEAEHRMDAIGQNGPTGDHYGVPELDMNGDPFPSTKSITEKQARYQDAAGEDWIDEAARTFTAEEFRGAMRFTIGKYVRRAGKKDALESEIAKIRDYAARWLEVEQGR